MLALAPVVALSAVFTTKLQPNTLAVWEKYVERFELGAAAERPVLAVTTETPALVDLNPNGDNAGEDVPNGYIHHWIGAIRIANATVADVQGVLEDYEHYSQTYSPDLKAASASRVDGKQYDVRLLTERVEGLGIHFAFDMRSRVIFHTADDFTLIDSRSYSIRESNSGRAPYTDLLPEGQDHGILWRLNSYWRLRQAGASVYAECQVISLSRKPLFGMRDQVKSRARNSLEATLRQTRNRALRLSAERRQGAYVGNVFELTDHFHHGVGFDRRPLGEAGAIQELGPDFFIRDRIGRASLGEIGAA
jgi:hypothetical protein